MRITGLPPSTLHHSESSPAHPQTEPAAPETFAHEETQGGHTRSKRGIVSNPFRRAPSTPLRTPSVVSTRPPVPPESPKPPARTARDNFKEISATLTGTPGPRTLPSQSHVAPKTLADVTQNLIVADRLHKAGVFANEPKLGTVARDAFVNAGINGLVSAPLSIATYAGSAWTGEAIKGQFASQTPILPPIHGPAPSTQVGGGAPVPDSAQVEAHLKLAELRIEVVANNIRAIRQGTDAPALRMMEQVSTTPNERLNTLEGLYEVAEKKLKLIGEDNDMIFRPFAVPAGTSPLTDAVRLTHLDKRFEAVNTFIGKLIVLKETELPKETPGETSTA